MTTFKETVNQTEVVEKKILPLIEKAENGISMTQLFDVAKKNGVNDRTYLARMLRSRVKSVVGELGVNVYYTGKKPNVKTKTETVKAIVTKKVNGAGISAEDLFEVVTKTVDVSLVELKDNYLNELANNGVIVKKTGRKEGDTRDKVYYFSK